MSSPYGPDVKASRKEIVDARIPPNFRDNCVDLLLQLNRCRFENFYLPWKCEHERHVYEVSKGPARVLKAFLTFFALRCASTR